MEMDYTNLKTYKTQLKYIKKIYQIKVNETDYLNKINELIKLLKNTKAYLITKMFLMLGVIFLFWKLKLKKINI